MKLLPIVPRSGAAAPAPPRFVRHSGTAVLLGRAQDVAPAEPPSIVIASEEVARVPWTGTRSVIAPRFDARFFSEAVRQGILPVALPDETIAAIGARVDANPREMITVNLDSQTIEVPGLGTIAFEAPPRVRRKLLHGLDDLEELLEHGDLAAAFRRADKNRRPWLYQAGR